MATTTTSATTLNTHIISCKFTTDHCQQIRIFFQIYISERVCTRMCHCGKVAAIAAVAATTSTTKLSSIVSTIKRMWIHVIACPSCVCINSVYIFVRPPPYCDIRFRWMNGCGLRWHSVCLRLPETTYTPWDYMIESLVVIVVLTAFIPCVNVRMNRSKKQKRNSNKFWESTEHTEQRERKGTEEKKTKYRNFFSYVNCEAEQQQQQRALPLSFTLVRTTTVCEWVNVCVCMCVLVYMQCMHMCVNSVSILAFNKINDVIHSTHIGLDWIG